MDDNLRWLSENMSASIVTITGSTSLLGNLIVSYGITGSLFGTSSWAVSASWAPSSTAITSISSSYVSGSGAIVTNLTSSNDASINGITIGRGAFSSNTNTAFGLQALSSNSSGLYNTAIGHQTLRLLTSGILNMANGFRVLNSLTTGNYNTAFGSQALMALTIGAYNTVIGASSANTLIDGSFNTIIGSQIAGLSSTLNNNIILADGQGNIKYRWDGIQNTISGGVNVTGGSITGSNALFTGVITAQTLVVQTITASTEWITGSSKFGSLVTDTHQFTGSILAASITGSLFGTSSWAISSSYTINAITASYVSGSGAIVTNLTSSNDASINGLRIGRGNNNQATNTVVGDLALYSNQTGTRNTAVGFETLYSNTTGRYNTAYGIYASYFNSVGEQNVAIGYSALQSNRSGSFNTILGGSNTAYEITSGSYNTILGTNSGRTITIGNNNTIIGGRLNNTFTPGAPFTTTMSDNVILGDGKGYIRYRFDGTQNNFYDNTVVTGSLTATQGFTGSLLGTASWAQNSVTSSYPISVIGSTLYSTNPLTSQLNATNTIALGDSAGFQARFANNSNFLGQLAGYQATSASNSNFLGYAAGFQAREINDSNFLGQLAGYQATLAANSNFIGYTAGQQATLAANSNFIGYKAGYKATSASYSILLGYQAGYNAIPTNGIGSNNIIIGTNITLPDNASSAINIGGILFGTGSYNQPLTNPLSGSANGKIGINNPTPIQTLDISGSLRATGSIYFPGVSSSPYSNVVTIDTTTGQLYYTASSAFGGGGGGVTQLLAGSNITLSPSNGLGQVTITSTGGGGPFFNTSTGSYGSFYSTQTQTNVASTARSMSLNVTDITNGVSVSGSTDPFNTYIKIQNTGVYNIQFSAQVDKTDSGTDEIWIWVRKNGTNLTDTATSIQLVGNGAHYVAAWNFFVNALAGDYFQLMWYSPDANVRLHAEPAFGVVPGIPSLIVTANRVDQFLSNTGSFSGSFTGLLFGTASWAVSASWAPNSGLTGGQTNYVTKWASSTTLTTGSIYDSASLVGIGTTAPKARLEVSGSVIIDKTVSNLNSTPILSITGSFNTIGNATALYLDIDNLASSTASVIDAKMNGSSLLRVSNIGTFITSELQVDNNIIINSPGAYLYLNDTVSSNKGFFLNTNNSVFSIYNDQTYQGLELDSSANLKVGGNIIALADISSSNNVYFKGLTTANQSNVVTVDTTTGQLYYTASSAIGGGSVVTVSGTYTPTLTAVYNVTSFSAYELQYMRVGNVVTVSGYLTSAATATNTWTRISISLPISSTFDFSIRAGGGGGASATNNVCSIQAGAFGTSVVYLDSYPNTTSTLGYTFSFTYLIM